MNLKIEKKILKSISRYLSFFFMVAFLVTCSTALFATLLSDSLNVKLNGDNLDIAAKLTFANVIILSLLFTIIDAIRRKLTVERAAKQIKNAASRLVKGDFSARVEPIKSVFVDDNLKEQLQKKNPLVYYGILQKDSNWDGYGFKLENIKNKNKYLSLNISFNK